MKKIKPVILSLAIFLVSGSLMSAQSYRNGSTLSLENIMKGTLWTGMPPENVEWGISGKDIYFQWNPENEAIPSMYKYNLQSGKTDKLSDEEKKNMISLRRLVKNKAGNRAVFVRDGKLYEYDYNTASGKLLLELSGSISSAFFSKNDKSIYFITADNLFKFTPENNNIHKITNFVKEAEKPEAKKWSNEQEEWLYKDQMRLFDVLKENEKKDSIRKAESKELEEKNPVAVPMNGANIYAIEISGDERYVTYISFKFSRDGKRTEMPRFVTETGFTATETIRSKVGYPFGEMNLGIIDLERDTFYYADASDLPGIKDYYVFGEEQTTESRDKAKQVYINSPVWSPERDRVVVNIRSADNKDRWIAAVDLETGKLTCLDHQNDGAWIAGPGIGWSTSSGVLDWLNDNHTIYFQSEETGYSHLYLLDVEKGKKKALTEGKYEVYDPFLSEDQVYFFFTSNEKDPGEHHFYRIPARGGKKVRLTDKPGNNDVSLSPDEKTMVIRYSFANQPWELYTRKLVDEKNNTWSDYKQITVSTTGEFRAYNWRVPEFIKVTADDGAEIPARLYRPEPGKKNGAAVIFVHGAGYLQNAHKWWSSYYREYMFHNFLADNGYTVLDLDYRASAGYGRDWRTAIYRHMGGKDLSDNVDGAKYLVEKEGIDPDRLGIYGGSYGGFITLMAQFTAPGTFKAGAALRPVTDWAHYNHGYTSNILNTPFQDSISYRRSSPIYFADGLEDHLIVCHGMVDDNVHFQDVVRLSQRLIELQKDKWELAVYPVEPHSFREWTSWLDEYKRIYRLFEENLFKE